MQTYAYGSTEGIEALQEAICARDEHLQNFSGAVVPAVNALETACFAGHDWAERFFGLPVAYTRRWAERMSLREFVLSTEQALELVEAMVAADDLGDGYAHEWLGAMADAYEVCWV